VTTYRVTYQNYTGFREKFPERHPPISIEDFPDKATADARKRQLQADGLTACVTELAPPTAGKKRTTLPEPVAVGKNRFNKAWQWSP
jgi:hypothetical protein